MPSHQHSAEYSRRLCDTLLGAVRGALGNAQAHTSANWCSYSAGDSARFCFIQHNAKKIRIFLKAEEADGPQLMALLPTSGSIEVVPRKTMTSDWAAITAYFVDILREEQIAAVVPVLVRSAHTTVERSSAGRGPHTAWNSPSEIISPQGHAPFWEGARATILVNRYERNQRARKACIKKYGAVCAVCDFDFAQRYGSIGVGFIHVHHLISLSSIGRKYKLNPITDLRPVCPNCHEMLHRQNPPLSVGELKKRLPG